jgi:hypothetical protein
MTDATLTLALSPAEGEGSFTKRCPSIYLNIMEGPGVGGVPYNINPPKSPFTKGGLRGIPEGFNDFNNILNSLVRVDC